MDPDRKNADSFGTFLEILQGKSSAGQTPDQAAMRLLMTLEDSGPLAVPELWSRTGLDLTAFATALKTAKDGGFVKSSGNADAEILEITDSGAQVAALARNSP
jgi:hypothetical protein